MTDEMRDLQRRLDDLERNVANIQQNSGRGIRRQSSSSIGGWPWYAIAIGPDWPSGEMRGHARGIVAIGDLATGLLAIGGVARGLIAFGGLAIGGICFGGCSLAVLLAVGGLAVGGVALGGAAIGLVAAGGLAVGYYACGGNAVGEYIFSATRQDPEAVEFFRDWVPWMDEWARGGFER